MFINTNGIIGEEENFISAKNRAFQYGDALFETINWRNGNALFVEDHLQRLQHSMSVLQMDWPEFFSIEYFNNQFEQITIKNNCNKSARIRLQVYREAEGLYLPNKNKVSFVITASSLDSTLYQLNERPLNIGFYNENKKAQGQLSTIKSTNALLYILAALYAGEKKFDDCFLFNENENVIEAISSNIFILNDKQLFTPPLTDGCINGIMRIQIIKLATQLNISCIEKSMSIDDVLNADEILLTNTIQGIRVVKREKDFEMINQLLKKING